MAKGRFVTTTRRPGKNNSVDGISIIVLCGNMGYRMKSYGPKALLAFSDGSLLIDRLLDSVSTCFPQGEIIVGVGFEADRVIAKLPQGIHVVENQLYEDTNDLEEVRLCLNVATKDSVLIVSGDLTFNNIALDKVSKHGSSIIVNKDMGENEIGVTTVDDIATIFAYDLPLKWCNIVYLTGKELVSFKKICKNREKGRWYIFEALNEIVHKGGKFHVSCPKHMEINRIEKLKDWKKIE